MIHIRIIFGLLMLVTTKLAVADTTDRFASVGCWPEIGLVQVEAVSAWNVDRYDAKSLEKKHSVYTDSFETTCQGVRVKVERHPTSGTGMCGADPSADIYVWLDGKPVLNRELFGNSCGSSYIQKVQVDLGDELVVCLAGWWQKNDSKKNSTTLPYTGYSIGDRSECRSISLRNIEYPLNLRRLFHDSTLQP